MMHAGLQQWLSDLIQVREVTVEANDATLSIAVRYTVILTQGQQTARFVIGGTGA